MKSKSLLKLAFGTIVIINLEILTLDIFGKERDWKVIFNKDTFEIIQPREYRHTHTHIYI